MATRRGRESKGYPPKRNQTMALLRLHVWGPAFGLASIDAECLATITYLAYALPAARVPAREEKDVQNDKPWELVATSPSAVPTRKSSKCCC